MSPFCSSFIAYILSFSAAYYCYEIGVNVFVGKDAVEMAFRPIPEFGLTINLGLCGVVLTLESIIFYL